MVTRRLFPHDLLNDDNGHDTCDHKKTTVEPGITEDPDITSVETYKCGTKSTTDPAANYILDEYERPKEVRKLKDNFHYDHHTR